MKKTYDDLLPKAFKDIIAETYKRGYLDGADQFKKCGEALTAEEIDKIIKEASKNFIK
jgi:hypothetical protein